MPQYGVVQASLPVKRLYSNFYFLLFLIFAFEAPNQARLTHTANCKLETNTEMHAGLRLLIKVLLKSVVCILPWIAVCSPQSSFYTDQLRSQYFLSDISINIKLLAFYHKCCSPIGCSSQYAFCCRQEWPSSVCLLTNW